MSNKKILIGFSSVLLATLMFGAGGSITKIVYSSGVPPLLLMKIRFLFSCLILFFCMLAFAPKKLKIAKEDILRYVFLGVVGFGGFVACAMFALRMIDVGVAVFLQYLSPAIIILYLWLCKGSKPSNVMALAVSFSILGGLLMVFGEPIGKINVLGITLGVMSAVLYAVNTIYGNKMSQKYGPFTTLFYSFFFGAIFWLSIPMGSVLDNWQVLLNAPFWMYVYIVLCYTLIPYGLIFIGIYNLQPTTLSVVASLEPIVAAIFAFFVLGEMMSFIQILGGVLVFSAVVLLQKKG